MVDVTQLALWDIVERKATPAQQAQVVKHLTDAANLLDRIIETFPTYTRHDSAHAINVVSLMASLLGTKRRDLSALEAAILLLSAFFHDIGMVFAPEERERLRDEPEWKLFLAHHADAYLATKDVDELPIDIAEWYCRWRHADRVYTHINRLPADSLKWGHTSFREELGEVCRSHTSPAVTLKELRTDYRTDTDLRFCAVLLRLADILDFDGSRSPEVIHDYLGLARRRDAREATSDLEWRKHLCSEGFRFPHTRASEYSLPLIAGPDDPEVEHALRRFLDEIDGELEQCRAVLDGCSARWRKLHLPREVDRSDIHSNGYRYGEYRFTLDQRQVMQLLMGENLYEDPHIFVRELLQNAIDTSRHRRFVERAQGKPNFEPEPVRVWHWTDIDGYQWLRFDDCGMGMNETIVREHLLKVGSSYYQTSSFRADILRVRDQGDADFVPISRFGIGLLSCFISGDRVEISTLRHPEAGKHSDPLRLSLNGLHGFLTLQTPQLVPLPLPAATGTEYGYRTVPGTSVAVRIDPRAEAESFEPRLLLEQHLSWAPVQVSFNGALIGGDSALVLDHPWCEPTTVSLDSTDMMALSERLSYSLSEPFRIKFAPVDLTKNSVTPELRGQVVIGELLINNEFEAFTEAVRPYAAIAARLGYDRLRDQKRLVLTIEVRGRANGDDDIPEEFLPFVSRLSDNDFDLDWDCLVEPPIGELQELVFQLESRGRSWLSHNGVTVPNTTGSGAQCKLAAPRKNTWITGVLHLTDSLRPEVSVSRDRLVSLPWAIQSACNLSYYRGLLAAGVDVRREHWSLLRRVGREWTPTLGDLLDDQLLRRTDGWGELPIIVTSDGIESLHELLDKAKEDSITIAWQPEDRRYMAFLDWCAAGLLQLHLNIVAEFVGRDVFLVASSAGAPPIPEGLTLFWPLAAVNFSDQRRFRTRGILNLRHPLTTWLVEKAPEISRRYPGLFGRFRNDLTDSWIGAEEAIARINRTLQRLRELHPSVRPPTRLAAAKSNFS